MKYLQIEVARGKKFYYFRRARGCRVRLPDVESPGFEEAYHAAMAGTLLPKLAKIEPKLAYQVSVAIRRGILRARASAAKDALAFDLTTEWALALILEQKFRCALTGVKFFDEHNTASRSHPYAPSIDRIKAGEGYTQDNCRIVCHAANVMLFDWGEDVFRKAASGLMRSRTGLLQSASH